MDLMEARRRILLERRIRVTWNQQAWPINADYWCPQNSTKISVAYSDGVATITYLADQGGADGCIRGKTDAQRQHPVIGEVWYGAYMVNPDWGTPTWSIDFCNYTHPMRVVVDANKWSRLSGTGVAPNERELGYHMYISNIRNSGICKPNGHIVKIKRPVLVNLTQMYGAGNEPDTEEFERQCVLNGIDLTAPLAVDTGTERIWKV